MTVAVFFCLVLAASCSIFAPSCAFASSLKPFIVKIVDAETGRGIPLVEFELENGLKMVSDNDGHIAIISPDLFGHKVRFRIEGHGYSTQTKDFWGQESVTLQIEHDKELRLELTNQFPAHRLYRITGAGRFNHTLIAGKKPSFPPGADIFAQVIGQDSLIAVPWQNRLWFFYGDTLGLNGYNFSASCATIPLPGAGAYDPEIGIPLEYLRDDNGFARKMIDTGKKGFTWIEYVLPVQKNEKPFLLAKYVQHATLESVEEAGFAMFGQTSQNFWVVKRWPGTIGHKCTHPYPVTFAGKSGYLLFPWEFCVESIEEIIDESRHLVHTCLIPVISDKNPNSSVEFFGKKYRVDRDKNGQVIYRWEKGGVAVAGNLRRQLVAKELLKPGETPFAPILIENAEPISSFNGAIAYNHFKKCWIAICQGNNPGEIIYSEADRPTGPWAFARKIIAFSGYNLYNPVIHPWFGKNNDRTIFFEGTYTNFFSSSTDKTPEADYNQVMFKLDLNRPELVMPIAIYKMTGNEIDDDYLCGKEISSQNLWNKVDRLAFFAFSQEIENPDLIRLSNSAGRPYSFKVLATRPATSWGQNWSKKNHGSFTTSDNIVPGGRVICAEFSLPAIEPIEPADWN